MKRPDEVSLSGVRTDRREESGADSPLLTMDGDVVGTPAFMSAIRAAYPDLDLKLQMGRLPIGPDPASGLWEFAHLMTGVPAERGPDGKLILSEEAGVVLVLLRGGSFWMGAQMNDPDSRNHDPQAKEHEDCRCRARLSGNSGLGAGRVRLGGPVDRGGARIARGEPGGPGSSKGECPLG